MPQVINTNLMSLVAQNALNGTQSSLSTAMQRLSTGLRINSAADDAAGFAIATGMQSQINGDTVAERNANDGISLAQTAGSALSQITNDLQTIRQLAVQSSNATNTASNRQTINSEVQQEVAEVTRIAQQTTYNGKSLLTGVLGTATFQIGANVGQTISVDMSQGTQASQIGQLATAQSTTASNVFSEVVLGANDLEIQVGASGTPKYVAAGAYSTAANLASAINTAYDAAGGTGNLATTNSAGELAFTNASTSDAVTITGTGGAANLGLPATVAKATQAAATPTTETTGSTFPAELGGGGLVLAAGDLTVQAGGGSATDVAAATYTSASTLAAAINAAYNTSAGTSGVTFATASGNSITFSNSSTTDAVTFAGSSLTALDLASSTVDKAIAGATTDGTADSTGVASTLKSTPVTFASGDFSIQSGSAAAVDITGTFSSLQDLVSGINAQGIPGVSAYVDSTGNLQITSQAALTIDGNKAGTGTGDLGFAGTGTAVATSGDLAGISVDTVDDSNVAMARVDAAIAQVSSVQSTLGAMQNRFDSVVSNLQSGAENLTAAQSRIEDADFAKETAALSKAQILQQAGVSMLAQANAQPQLVLKLLQ